MEFVSIIDLGIPQPETKQRRMISPREKREVRCTRNLFMLLETRRELRGVYAPADQIAETLRWSA